MTYNKITTLELQEWNEFYWEYFRKVGMETPGYKNATPVEQEKANKIAGIIFSQIKLGNTLTIIFFVDNLLTTLKLLPAEIRNRRSSQTNNLTAEEYLTNIKKRVKEHHIARDYYNPNNPSSRSAFKERAETINSLKDNSDKNYRDKIFSQMNDEDLSFVWNFIRFGELLKEIYPNIDFSKSEEPTEEEWKEIGFLLEDLVKTIETAQEKLKQSQNTTSSSQNLTAEEKEKIVKKMVDDKSRLKTQKEKLENQTPNNDLEKSLRNQLLADNAREIAERDKEIDRLLKNTPSPKQENNKGNSKLNWAIGLGIVAVLIGLVCLILLANRRKER